MIFLIHEYGRQKIEATPVTSLFQSHLALWEPFRVIIPAKIYLFNSIKFIASNWLKNENKIAKS